MNNEKNKSLETGLEVAVIGMAARFPGAGNIDEYWDNLKNGVASIHFFSDKELEEVGYTSQLLKSPNYVKAKGYLEDSEYFDASFFGFKPSEAEQMDPQMRIFYQICWQALEDAGYNSLQYKGLIGLYAGAAPNLDWEMLTFESSKNITELFVGSQLRNKDYLCTGVSYKLNLKGPSFTLDTACSTSIVAIHLACQALLSGECDIALAGGVSVNFPAKNGYIYQPGLLFSPDGNCRTFDAKADGTVFGDGAGVVVLKSLEDALADGDTIDAVIKGSAINNDGSRKVGFTASSAKGQAEVIRSAYNDAEVNPETIGYIEAHGTGTSLGDPIEIEALTLAFDTDKRQYCSIGSVKTNVGHLNAAAGAAGFIKSVLALRHQCIPPTLHFENPNPKIDFENTPFYVNTSLIPWKRNGGPLRAGVASFGVGGTNGHVILEEPPPIDKQETGAREEYQLIPLSAKTEAALERMTENLANYFKKNPHINLADAAYTLQMGREAFSFRRMTVCTNVDEVIDSLANPESGRMDFFHAAGGNIPVVFMFPGQGAQYVNMGAGLYETEAVFREEMDHCFHILKSRMECDLKSIVYPGTSAGVPGGGEENPGKINRTEITQPMIFIFEYALAKMLMKWGIEPKTMIGHSIGEYTAACLSGVFSLEDALGLVTLRGKLMQQVTPGKMLSVTLPEQQVRELLDRHQEVELAAVNSTSLCVVSGPAKAIDRFAAVIDKKGCKFRILHTSHAFHSRSMDPVIEAFKEKIGQVKRHKPGIPYISNVTGRIVTSDEVGDPRYWATHLRETVRFADGLTQLLDEQDTAFVEVGPGNVMSTFVRQHKEIKPEHKILNLIRHPREELSDRAYLLNKLGRLWVFGKKINWEAFQPEGQHHRIPLPHYSFDRERYWDYADNHFKQGGNLRQDGGNRKTMGVADWFYRPFWKQKPPNHLVPLAENAESSVWMVFTDRCPLGGKLVEQLEKQGQDVIRVEPGRAFEKKSGCHYVIHPGQPEDYRALINEISGSQDLEKPRHILYLWGVTGEDDGIGTGDAGNTYFNNLLWLVQAMDKGGFTNPIQLTVLSDNLHGVTGQERLQPHKSLLIALVRVIPKEYPHIVCRGIDILLPAPGSPQEETLPDRIIEEAAAKFMDPVVAFRNGLRWVPGYEPVKLEKTIKAGSPLREKGVWLITGGLGRVGLILAKELAASVNARLILTGRSEFPGENQWQEWLDNHDLDEKISLQIKQLLELKQLGAEIMVCQADVSSREQMNRVIHEADERFGAINGVIHTAGVIDYSTFLPLNRISEKECRLQFKPKIDGIIVLDEILRGRELDLCLLTSSLSAISGGNGYGMYVAANIFMDAFAGMQQRTAGQHWLSVNLDAWQPESQDSRVMTPSQGVEAFSRLLSWREGNQIVISVTDLQTRIKQWNTSQSAVSGEGKKGDLIPGEAGKRRPRPHLSNPYVEAQTPLEKQLVEIARDFFGIDQLGIHDNFFDIGASSLDLVQLGGNLNTALGKEIPVVELFRFSTVNLLAKYLEEESGMEKPLQEIKEKKEKKRSDKIKKGRVSMQDRLQLVKGEKN